MRQSIENLVKDRIIDHGRGWCFTPMHFSDLGNDPSIRKALSLLQKQNFIRRLAQGIYDYPIMHDLIKKIQMHKHYYSHTQVKLQKLDISFRL